ncbi:MAG: phytoene/squalene synthase family protein [Planctomycetes bacterium]|nr:phytoene/squalene synthase family protein [Planctomycetota bacterium]
MSRRRRQPDLPPAPSDGGADLGFCTGMLPRVSRTFAACIRLLPPPLDHHVLVAYLLCRVADTIEDTADLPVDEKERLLAHFARSLAEDGSEPRQLCGAFAHPRTDDELLAREAPAVWREFRGLPEAQRAAIAPWVREMCAGMAEFARIHSQARPDRLVALTAVADLDRYCYYVAGTVGHLLTELFRLHHPRVTRRHHARLKELATSFGLGLQLTNIIKDVADDRSRGWSFVPRQLCQLAGISPEDLLAPSHRREAALVMNALIAKARIHLSDALDYCTALPRSQYRIRLFCLTPLYFAIRTLALAERDPALLDPGHKVKITRGEVYRTICMTYVLAPNNHLVRAYYRQLAAKTRVGARRGMRTVR